MEPLLPLLAGLAAIGAGALVLRSFGSGYRVGRLLAGTPLVSVEEADRLARSGVERYVRIEGRLDSAEDFPDENDRPLVYRRARLEARRTGSWTLLSEELRHVPFEVRDGLTRIAVDGDRLDVGLVVLPRESTGTAGEIPDRVPADLPPTTQVRLRVDQVSSVEQATVLGVPRAGSDGLPVISSGLRRPLILSTLEPVEAMQLLAGGRRGRPALALALLAGGLVLFAIGLGWAAIDAVVAIARPAVAFAASPDPSAAGDTRSAGEGPGLVGAPIAAILVVAAIALASVVVTLAYIRLTRPPARD